MAKCLYCGKSGFTETELRIHQFSCEMIPPEFDEELDCYMCGGTKECYCKGENS